jgi:hypothetical protein
MNKLIGIFMLALALVVSGCASTGTDKNFAMQIEAYSSGQRANADVAKAKADAERARYEAIAEIGKTGDATAKVASVIALALGNGSAASSAQPSSQPLPQLPESDADKAFKWASLIAGPLTNVAQGFFGYKLGVVQSNNQTAMSIANTNAFASTAAAGFGANTSIASSGFNAAGNIASAGFNSTTSIAALIQAPAPNLTLSGTGVIGSGSYTAPITTTRTCTGGPAAAGNAAPSGSTGTAGSSGTTGQGGSSGTTGQGGPGPSGNGGAAGC